MPKKGYFKVILIIFIIVFAVFLYYGKTPSSYFKIPYSKVPKSAGFPVQDDKKPDIKVQDPTIVILQCPPGTVKNNAGGCDVVNSINPNPTNPGYSSSSSLSDCVPSGYIKEAYVYHRKKIGDSFDVNKGAVFSMVFVVTNECDANFYFEGGLSDSSLNPLSILVTQPSACDLNPHYAGKNIVANKNTIFSISRPPGELSIAFFPYDYGKEGDLTIKGGAYTGCINKGGRVIKEISPQKLILNNGYTDSEITNSFMRII